MSTPAFPKHIAIIMDGNGRWADTHGLMRIKGHKAGADNAVRLTTFCSKTELEVLTLYAFSVENWNRPPTEVKLLMQLLRIFAVTKRKLFMDNNVRLRAIGDLSRIPKASRAALEETIRLTGRNTGLILQLAINYGGRDELVRAMKALGEKIEKGALRSEEIDERKISVELDTQGLPDPDLIIRTSGELRISNYLLWQAAYSEYYFTNTFWPDFTEDELCRAVDEFNRRERRFGGVGKNKASL